MASNYFQLHKEVYKPFTFTVDTTIAGSSGVGNFQLPFVSTASYRCIVDWGDGNVDKINAWNQAETLHTYSVAGTYTIKIRGRCDHANFWAGSGGDRLKLSSIDSWGNIVWKSFEQSFLNCSNMVANFTDTPILEYVTNMRDCFYNCVLYDADMSNWDMSNITDIRNLFRGASVFNNGGSSGINNWDVSNIVGGLATQVFQDAISFNQPIGNWDVSNITDFTGFFNNADSFNQNLNSWDVSSAITMTSMFRGNGGFNNGASSGVATTMTWTMGSSLNDVREMFLGALAFNADISSWNMSNVTVFTSMFRLNSTFNNGGSANINNWTIKNTGTVTMNGLFRDATAFNQPIHNWDVSAVNDLGLFMSGKSTANYSTSNLDLIYNTWSTLTLQTGVIAHFGSIQYTIAVSQSARNILTNAPNNWIITDGGGI